MIIIPAIDIIDGKCVRLTKGDYNFKTVYNEDPLEVAMQFEDAGLKRLHLVDLDGARTGNVKNWRILEKIAGKTALTIDFSGGISTEKDLEIAFDSGAVYAAIGSLAVKNEQLLSDWLLKYGAQKFIIGADVKEEMIVVKGWTVKTEVNVFELVEKYRLKSVRQFFCTDVNKDGLLSGPSLPLYKKLLNQFPSINLIASGGVTTLNDLDELREAGCYAAIVGKAIYENRISLSDLKKYIIP